MEGYRENNWKRLGMPGSFYQGIVVFTMVSIIGFMNAMHSRRLIFVLLIAVLASASAPAALAQAGREAVDSFLKEVVRPVDEKNERLIKDNVAFYMNFEEMARRALGKQRWERMTLREQRDFVGAFKKVMEQRYYPRWRRLFARSKCDFVSERTEGSDTLVVMSYKIGRKTDKLIWRLAPNHGSLRVIDLTVGNKDLLERASARLRKGADEKGTQGLIAWLRKKAKEKDGGAPEPLAPESSSN
ncbi:MAG TPA: ABC transporter substrate-binding protein [Candidatus Obscuribacterales bacterium]